MRLVSYRRPAQMAALFVSLFAAPSGRVQAAEPTAASAEPPVIAPAPAPAPAALTPAERRAIAALQTKLLTGFFRGKTVVLTGAGGGVGLALTKQLVANHATVVAGVKELPAEPQLAALAAAFPATLSVHAVDVTNAASVKAFKEAAAAAHVDVLINTAGINIDDRRPILELPEERVQATFDVNASGPVRVVQAFYPSLKASKRPIVANISSIMGSIGDNRIASSTAYRMSKAALNMFGKCLSIEQPDLLVLSLHPGWVRTSMGGKKADIDPPASAAGILRVIARAKKAQSGKFFRYTGEPAPW